jgi:hypothetical protein
MKLFSVAAYATRHYHNGEKAAVFANWVNTTDKQSAEAEVMEWLYKDCPTSEGWTYHTVVSIEIPEDRKGRLK